jgi:hypothetical protein
VQQCSTHSHKTPTGFWGKYPAPHSSD